MAYALDAEGNNGVNATTRIGNLDGFDFGVLLQLDGSQSDAVSALAAAGGTESAAIVAQGGGGGVVGIIAGSAPPPPASTIPNFQATGAGVHGITDATAVALFEPVTDNPATNFTAGVKGVSTSAIGVGGVSQTGTGVRATSTNGFGIFAQTGASGFAAGFFAGPVLVVGPLVVFGPKSAAVRVPGGSYRQLYCMESPESWFEDFGEAQLIAGKSEVKSTRNSRPVVKTRTITCS